MKRLYQVDPRGVLTVAPLIGQGPARLGARSDDRPSVPEIK